MARICSKCSYYTEASDVLTCPNCNVLLRFTLINPAGEQAPLPTARTTTGTATKPQSSALNWLARVDVVVTWCFVHRKLLLLVLVPVVILAGVLFGLGGLGGVSLSERYNQIQIGMDSEEVIDILGSDNGFLPPPVQFDEIPSDKDEDSFTWVWEEGGAKITLEFEKNKVVKKSQEGLK
jgi:hypothetical protein